ncbi:BQ5605_C022g09431 [Microbotryum silenes-dioicae]|uniref:BQ5605_C022g09431 protein n=1 Tax=Microbotryum silenes-dioicae TaxID=796604 RepID=A0A2X0MKM5_9BASI|nr:BQ5605_C022g09431 [Microbotryum silenes-dioicae]
MDAAAAKISAKGSRMRKKGVKAKAHHFFYVLVLICGWLAPPLAVAVRFGIGRDFFINVLCTICGYFPGHGHNFYCQSIRNNRTAARTPKWAVKFGLVHVKDKRGGKHAWAGRYDERLPDSARNEYADADSVESGQPGGAADWDGRGPEPANRPRFSGNPNLSTGGKKQHRGFHITSPWDDLVEEEEVQGNPRRPGDDDGRAPASSRPYDPLDNEEFFPSTSGADAMPASSASSGPKKLKGRGFLGKSRSRYENASSSSGGGGGGGRDDRFDRMNAGRPSAGGDPLSGKRTQAADDYQDDFEREINGAPARSKVTTNVSAPTSRFDSFESEGPEQAWASSRPSKTPARREEPALKPASSQGDGDLFNHTF